MHYQSVSRTKALRRVQTHITSILDELATVAQNAAVSAGEFLCERFTNGTTDTDYRTTDAKAHTDEAAERLVIETIRNHYLDHQITAEEAGHLDGNESYRWIIDALDGTNNFLAGIPTFGAAVTAVDSNDNPLTTAVSVPAIEAGTVAFVIGSPVVYGGAGRNNASKIRWELGQTTKRCIQTWAPVVHWGLREQVAGELLACEAGCIVRREGSLSVFAPNQTAVDALFETAISTHEPLS
jgi:myo-inositol-1(or 4)-monophosphatase